MEHLSKRYGIILFFVFLFITEGFAQISFDNPQVINKRSGLLTDHVKSLLKDDLGFMWIATDEGLCRWDGISVRAFVNDPADSTSIPGNSIPGNAFIFDTVSKQIILATENGLSFFDPHTFVFKNFTGKKKSTDYFPEIHSVFVDRQGVVWVGTNSCIFRFNRDGHTFDSFNCSGKIPGLETTDKNKMNNVFSIKQDVSNDSVLWLATLAGLLKFNKYSEKFDFYFFDAKKYKNDLNAFTGITAHSNGKLYLGTWNAGMVVFNTVNEKFEFNYGPYTSDPRYFLTSPLVPYLEKSDIELWASSAEGVGIFNTGNNKFKILKTFKNAEGHNYVQQVAFVDKNAIWLSSEYGIMRFRLTNKYFDNYFITPVDENHWFLPTSYFEDTLNKRLYIGYARGQGLNYFNLQTHTFHFISLSKRMIKENIVRAVFPLDKENILILSPDEIYKFSLSAQTPVPLKLKYTDYPMFTDITTDRNGNYWVSGSNLGLQQLNIKQGRLRDVSRVKKFYEKRGILPKIKGIIVDDHNRIWFRDEDSYGFYDPENDSMQYFGGSQALVILSFFGGGSDTIWAGTFKKGLGFINPEEPEKGIQIYNSVDNKSVISLQRDASGNFFLLTSSGVEKLVPGQLKTVVFDENEGLVKFDKWVNRDPTLPGLLFKLSDDRFVIGYRRGLGFFHPDRIRKDKEEFAPYISSLKVFGKDVPVEKGVTFSKGLELDHDQNSLTFEYSALAINNGKDIRFTHKLTDVDRDWVTSGHRNVNYSNLRPGNYRFMVKAESKSSPGLFREASLHFIIRPPWWNTWWAIAFYVLAFLGIIYIVYHYQLSRMLARKETARLKELDRLKSRLYANITHEFRTPLTVIKGMADEMIENMNPAEQKRFDDKLKMIERNSDKLLHLVRQMLDMSKIEDGKMKLNLIRDNIVSYLQYVLESFQSMADAKHIKLVFYHETGRIIMDYDPDKIFVIASNLLSNAIKFTPTGGKVIFHVKKEIRNDKEHLVIKVQDSGIGIEEGHLQHIFDRFYQVDNSHIRKGEGTGIGLALTKELVELMKGKINVKSIPRERTEVCVILPITKKAPLQKSKPLKNQLIDEPNGGMTVVTGTGSEDLPLALIVEDNPDVARYIISCLAGQYRINRASDGIQGIEAAISSIPDIIISDVMMPGKDGFELCETLKQDERTSHIPIILLTAKATETDRIEGLSHGADAYLTKPFNKKELFVRLEQLIKIRRALQEKYSRVEISLTEIEEPTGEERFLKKAIGIIEENLDSHELDASMLAANLNMSESQLYRKLKALSDKSISVFIRGIRLSAAKKLLQTSDFNISEIAYRCGFNDPAWFSRAFKEEFGLSPSVFRK